MKSNECGLLLSGGVDSISVGLASHYAGKSVHAYSFCLDNFQSYDFVKAKEVSDYMNWSFTPIIVPTQDIEPDFLRLVEMGCRQKTHFETVFPFLYVYPKINETHVLTGWGVDGYYGLTRKARQNYKTPKALFDEYRNNYFLPKKTAGLIYHKLVSSEHNKVMVNPYLEPEIKSFFFAKDWYELNQPKQKHHIRNAFDEFKSLKVKRHLNLQKESKIDLLFDSLLTNKKINFNGRTRMLDVYRDWKGVGSSCGALDKLF